MKILVTGGAGYIGSHTCIELIKAGYGMIILLILIVLYKIIKEAEKEVDSQLVSMLPWEELKAVTKNKKRIVKKKTDLIDAFDKASKIKKSEAEYYE